MRHGLVMLLVLVFQGVAWSEPTPTSVVMATGILGGEDGSPIPPFPEEQWPELSGALRHVAVKWEVMGKDDDATFTNRTNLVSDVSRIRAWRQELIDAPMVVESERFPPYDTAVEFLRFNQKFCALLQKRLEWELDRADILRLALNEAKASHAIWQHVETCRCPYYGPTTRRSALVHLRRELGDEAFLLGVLPPIVPEWVFN